MRLQRWGKLSKLRAECARADPATPPARGRRLHRRQPALSGPDGCAWAEIHALALRVALARLRDHGAAEEAAQEAALRLWRFRDSLDGVGNLEAWVVRVTTNEAARLRERRGRIVAREMPYDDRSPAVSFEATEELQERVTLLAGLGRLTEQDRKIFALHYFGDMPISTIADGLGMPAGTIKARLSRARRRMAKDMTA